MSVNNSVFIALMGILATKQPISASDLMAAMKSQGHDPVESRRAIQLAFERGRIELDRQMRVVIVESQLAVA